MIDDHEAIRQIREVLGEQPIVTRPKGMVFYINASIIDEVEDVLRYEGKIQAIKYLRASLQPFLLLGLRQAKRIVDQIEEACTREYTEGYAHDYRIFRDIP